MMSSEEYRDLKSSMDGRFTKVDERFATIDNRFAQIDQRFDEVDRRFVQLEASLREEIRTTAAETRRHFDVVAEDLKASIRSIAEGYGHHAAVLDDHESRLRRLEHPRLRFGP